SERPAPLRLFGAIGKPAEPKPCLVRVAGVRIRLGEVGHEADDARLAKTALPPPPRSIGEFVDSVLRAAETDREQAERPSAGELDDCRSGLARRSQRGAGSCATVCVVALPGLYLREHTLRPRDPERRLVRLADRDR